MNNEIPILLLYLFFGVSAIVLAFKVIRGKHWRMLDVTPLKSSWLPFVLSIAPITAGLLLGNMGDLNLAIAAPYFAGAAAIAFLLSQIGVDAEIRSLLLRMLAVGASLLCPAEFEPPILGALAGLLVWKTMENLLHKPQSRLDDITPAFVWLATFYWTKVAANDVNAIFCQGVVLATLLVSIFIRWVQPVLLPDDKIYLKRLLLSIFGGLALVALITKVLFNVELQTIAALGAGGYLFAYLLQSLGRNVAATSNLAPSIRNILLVGTLTLIATRLFGMTGLLVLAATTVIAPTPGFALIAGLFWASRVLLQAYVLQYNPNVTGINLMHTYTTAATYAGVLAILVLSVLINEVKDRRLLSAIFLASVCVTPFASNYFLHSEPTGSLLVSIGVTAVIMALLSPAVYQNLSAEQENLILVPALATTLALVSYELIELGEGASVQDRIVIMLGFGFVMICIALINHFLRGSRHRRQISAPNPSG